MSGFVVWMTGLSGTGKSTLASMLTTELTARGLHVECLDGDEVRKNLSHGLGFAREDRDRNVRRIGYVARMVARSGACSITAAISPYRALRDEIRNKTENFIEVYCECPLEVLTTRDPKGLYKRALAGEIKNFTGVDDPYEAPEQPEVHLRTDLKGPQECLDEIVAELDRRGLLETTTGVTSLPPPFGGELFQARSLAEGESERHLVKIEVSEDEAEEIHFVGDGYLSPVSGFMTEREAHKVEKSGALERGTPWFKRPFLLLLGETSVEGHETALITHEGKVVAEVACDEVWDEGGRKYLAGALVAVTGQRDSARKVRRILQERGRGSAACLFLAGPPSDARGKELALAARLAPALAIAVRNEHREQWQSMLSQLKLNCPVIGVPAAVPLESERAQTVIARSIGAAHFALG